MSDTISKEQLIQSFADAYEKSIAVAIAAAQRGVTHRREAWGPRETIAHLAGWEVMASVRIPAVTSGALAAGKPPFEFADEDQQDLMNDAINTMIVTMIGDQPLDTLCGMLRQAYQHSVELLKKLDNKFFQPGEYVYERTKDAIEHCQEHNDQLT